MSSISSPVFGSSVALTDLPVSRYPLLLWGLALLLAALAIARADIALPWVLLAAIFTLATAYLEWRRQDRVSAFWFDSDKVVCQLANGSLLEAPWPLSVVLAPWWISIGFPGRWRRRWIAVYRDQLDADGFRRLRVLARNP
ncbi:MAG: hypothetical protein ACK4SX_15390 [Alcanivoracaceae bacterium]